MSGISTGVGLFSGIDSASIIQQLLKVEARPRDLVAARVAQLQLQQTGYLDINSRLSALRDAARAFRDKKTFSTRSATSSDSDVLRGTAGPTAANGTYTFLVDRLVTTQQMLSRGFANSDVAALGATSFSFEPAHARLDTDAALADLNDGAGVSRGRIVVTDSAGVSATIDLSRATTVGDVLQAINDNGSARVSATVSGGRLVLKDTAGGGGTMTVANGTGYTTAASLGIAGAASGGTLTGSVIHRLHGNVTLGSLNDGRGVNIRSASGTGTSVWNFKISVSGSDAFINVGDVYETQTVNGVDQLVKVEGEVSTMQGLVDRINEQLADQGFTDVTASIDQSNGRLVITESSGVRTITVSENPTLGSSTAADLGILGTATGTINGSRLLAGLNTSLLRGLNGGAGLSGDGKIFITTRNGTNYDFDLDLVNGSVADLIATVDAATNGEVRLSLNERGNGLELTDLTGGPGNFIVTGSTGADTAASLGLSTGATGVASSSVSANNLQRQYVSRATMLASVNAGRGVGTGTFRITDSTGVSQTVNIDANTRTLGDVITKINALGLKVKASINSTGDGLVISEDNTSTPAGTLKIKIEDVSGTTAKALNLAKTAEDTGSSNFVDGSFERVVEFSAADTLQQMIDKINQAGAGVSAALVRDGAGATPYRLSLTSSSSGTAGRFLLDTGSFSLAPQTLELGRDALMFYGSTDAARAIAVTSSTNTVDTLLPGVRLDLARRSDDPVTMTIATDTEAIFSEIDLFVKAFNTVVSRIAEQTKYVEATQQKGPLIGDSTMLEVRSSLFRTIQAAGIGTSGRFETLAEIGITIGEGGSLKLDETRLRASLDEDPASVESLFTTREQVQDAEIEVPGLPGVTVRNPNAGNTFSALGVVGQIEQLATRFIDSTSGVLTGRTKAIDEQIRLQQARVTAMNQRLLSKQEILQKQFLAMETAIGKLQTQQSALASLG